MLPKEELIPIVDSAFDHARALFRVPNDTLLAKHLGTSAKTISELRNGHWTTVDAALIGVLVNAFQQTEHPSIENHPS